MTTTYNLPADYSTWALLYAVLDDAPLADVTVVKVASGEFNGGDGTFTAGIVPSATYTLTITCATGAQFSGNPMRYTDGARVLFDGAAERFSIPATANYVTISNLAIKATGSGATCIHTEDNADYIHLTNLICESTAASSTVISHRARYGSMTNVYAIKMTNESDTYGSAIRLGFYSVTGSTYKNCGAFMLSTSSGTHPGFVCQSGSVLTNCVSYGFAVDYNTTPDAASRNCATSKSSGSSNCPTGGTAQYDVPSTEFESVTNGSHDLRLKSTATKLLNTGDSGGSTTDILGNAASGTRDIGPFEYQAPASGFRPWIISHTGLDPGLRMGYLS